MTEVMALYIQPMPAGQPWNGAESGENRHQIKIGFWKSSPTWIGLYFFSGILHNVYIMAMQKEILLQFVLGSPYFDPRLTGLYGLESNMATIMG